MNRYLIFFFLLFLVGCKKEKPPQKPIVVKTYQNEMKGLAVDQGKVTFTTENESGVFKYSLMQKGDTLTGMIASQYGDFGIKAVKQGK